MDWEIVGIAGTLCAITFGYIGYQRGLKTECKTDGEDAGELKTDIAYIKKNIDTILNEQKDVLNEQKETNRNFSALSERMARVEERLNAHLKEHKGKE